jgi:hypothetical protein
VPSPLTGFRALRRLRDAVSTLMAVTTVLAALVALQ